MLDRINLMQDTITFLRPLLGEFSKQELQCILGMVTDEWAALNKLSAQETFEILEEVARVQKQVYAECGEVDYI